MYYFGVGDMAAEDDDDYTRRLDATLARFEPLSDDARRRLVQAYEAIDVSEPAAVLATSGPGRQHRAMNPA